VTPYQDGPAICTTEAKANQCQVGAAAAPPLPPTKTPPPPPTKTPADAAGGAACETYDDFAARAAELNAECCDEPSEHCDGEPPPALPRVAPVVFACSAKR
jgi:hypothetical protein